MERAWLNLQKVVLTDFPIKKDLLLSTLMVSISIGTMAETQQKPVMSTHEENTNDVAFIAALIDHLIKKFNADPKRVYATGMSNGAMMSYRLGCELSGKIAAIAPVAGNIPKNLIQLCSPSLPGGCSGN